jgi:predicted nucleic acid-binding protein
VILADSSVWVAHFRTPDPSLVARLEAREILGHPFVIGELAMGNLSQRRATLRFLGELPNAIVASHDEVMNLIERDRFNGLGVGYVDAHLLASARLTPDARLWTRDQRLGGLAARLGVSI